MREKIATTCYETYVKAFGVDPGGFDALPDWAKERWLSVADAVISSGYFISGESCRVSDAGWSEIWGNWWKCGKCGEDDIHESFRYCPHCGCFVDAPRTTSGEFIKRRS